MALCFQYFTFLSKIFLFTFLLVTFTESLSTHKGECLALYLFKQSFLHPPFEAPGFQTFDSWKITSNASNDVSDCCLWDGVVCSNKEEDGHVISLDLSERYLRGHINSSSTLFDLVHLHTLNLAMNDFSESQIPSQIFRLKQLRTLNLSHTGLSGQIPSEMSHLMQLSSLDMSGNSLKLQSPSLEKLVQNFTKLEELDLSGVEISSSVPYFLANFSSLRSIKLISCFLQNEFPMAILQLPKLNYLDVSINTNLTGFLPEFHNNSLLEHLDLFTTGFSGAIPKSIENLKRLIFLNLGDCSFLGIIPASLANMTQLTYLRLRENEFTSAIPSFASLTKLTVLDLGGNKFEKGGLPDWLGQLTELNDLFVYQMNLHGEIPLVLANLTKLRLVEMRKNYLSGCIPSWFMNLTQLSRIDLGQNQLQGPIPSSFSNFKSLQAISLPGNNFSGRVDLDWFLGLSKLEDLILGGNRLSIVATNNYTNGTLPELNTVDLSSCNLKEYPTFLHFQPKITALFLYDNNINGLMPEWSWNNSQKMLEIIDLSYNFITGFHHQDFLPWAHLRAINIAYNLLQGRLPIPPRTAIYYVVSNNNLEGEISPLICEAKSLVILDLSFNNITGILPPCFGSLSNSLFMLDLKRNNLQGIMMDSFTQGSPLKGIDLSENQFVPIWNFSLLVTTPWMVMGNVSSQFPKLRIIDLSNNGFIGQLPYKYFQTWNAMKLIQVSKSSAMQLHVFFEEFEAQFPFTMTITYKGFKTEYPRILNIFVAIDLSCNNFEGEIPQSLEDLRGLESLNLSNNHLTGHVLSSLGNLKNLESLDLSQNKLSGEIPSQLLQLDFLAILNLSFNYLEGYIPQGKQFNTFEYNSYMGNLGLCGKPLSKECQSSKAPTPPQTSNQVESFLPGDRVDWIIISFGIASGLVVGVVFGNFLYTKYSEWVIVRFRLRKDKWIRPLRNTSR